MPTSTGWGILVALVCVLLAARFSSRGFPLFARSRPPEQAGTEKKKLWIQRETGPRRSPGLPPEAAAGMEGPAPTAGDSDSGGGEGMPTTEQLKDLLSRAQSHLGSQDSGDGEGQVKAAMVALAAVRSVMAAQGRTEEEVMQAMQAAAAEGRQVVASETRPGPNWRPLLPQDLGADASLLGETGRSSIIGDAAVDAESYVCPNCAGVVPLRRRSAHDEYWCSAVDGSSDEDGAEHDEGEGAGEPVGHD